MRILYVASQYDYGERDQGFSFEHENFYGSLVRMGHEVIYFDFRTLHDELGRDEMNRRLRRAAEELQPTLLFACLTGDELDFATVKAISESAGTTTFNWFCDDHWRFERFSSRWAPAFNWVATTASAAVPEYRRLGYSHVIKTQWACNHFQYRRLDLPLRYEASFVGRVFRDRPRLIHRLRRAGIDVVARGQGWPEGRVAQEEMVRIFNQSRVNLNFSAPAKYVNRFKRLLGRRQPPPQIKGRNFEVPGCGGFLLTDRADNLEDYYAPGREIAVFEGFDDLVDKLRYYLDHQAERAAIADAGYRRTLREHTYELRFREIFQRMGLPAT
jgi:spore maturation protein CgeB